MAAYSNMEDYEPCVSNDVVFTENMFSKFCYFGFVGTSKWDITYIVLLGDGIIRVYDRYDI